MDPRLRGDDEGESFSAFTLVVYPKPQTLSSQRILALNILIHFGRRRHHVVVQVIHDPD